MASVTRINKGLDLPIQGGPAQTISAGPALRQVALVGDDYIGMKPTMLVGEGDRVRLGQAVFTDKKTPGVQYTAPATGTVARINRGSKRKFESLVIELADGVSQEGLAEVGEQETFDSFPGVNLAKLDRRQVCAQLVASGLWTALRTRPYSRVPPLEAVPKALFVTAIDTNPLAADPAVVLARSPAEFIAGLEVLSTLTEGYVHVCRRAGSDIPGDGKTPTQFHAFDGPHPAGLVGTHVHLLEPVCHDKSVWHIGYQDVVAVGHLFLTGRIATARVVSLAGPIVNKPRLVWTRLGASLTELTADEFSVAEGQTARVISGSVLSGRASLPPADFLGRYHSQVSILAEGGRRELLGWLKPGTDKFSIRRIFASGWNKGTDVRQVFPMTTSIEGSPRAIIPIGMYEDVLPLDIVATPLLKSLLTHDTEFAQQLGVLELDEEDLALCTFVCPGKVEYGPLLRESLTTIEREG
ncbi:MAG: Na(+)-translocating NADH-quinone reductase subunit A [Pirellulales bacterium]|nr:Na(+)-translocating NADH-quinone reductase subunit A [Pirellulales bacterium]